MAIYADCGIDIWISDFVSPDLGGQLGDVRVSSQKGILILAEELVLGHHSRLRHAYSTALRGVCDVTPQERRPNEPET